MKKKYVLFISVLFLVLSVFITIPVHADSGSDTSYDSGSSSDSSYNYDNNYGDETAIFFIVFFAFYMLFKKDNKKVNKKYKDIEFDKIAGVVPDFNIVEFKKEAFNIYKDIQEAWMDFDKDKLKKLTTDEIYKEYNWKLDLLKNDNQQNIMKDIMYVDSSVINVSKDNGITTVETYMIVTCYDYVINSTTNEVIKGSDTHKLQIEYLIDYVSTDNNKYVMSSKRNINQRFI